MTDAQEAPSSNPPARPLDAGDGGGTHPSFTIYKVIHPGAPNRSAHTADPDDTYSYSIAYARLAHGSNLIDTLSTARGGCMHMHTMLLALLITLVYKPIGM